MFLVFLSSLFWPGIGYAKMTCQTEGACMDFGDGMRPLLDFRFVDDLLYRDPIAL